MESRGIDAAEVAAGAGATMEVETAQPRVELSQWRGRHRSDPGAAQCTRGSDARPIWSWPLFPRKSQGPTTAGERRRLGEGQADLEAAGSAASKSGRGMPLLANGLPVEVRQVQLVEADAEWGGGLALTSSSSDSDSGFRGTQRRKQQAPGAVQDRCDPERREVQVVQVAAEWRGLGQGGLDSGSSSSSWGPNVKGAADRNRRLRGSVESTGPSAARPPSHARGAEDAALAARRPICPREVVFAMFALLHMSDFSLRLGVLVVYWHSELFMSMFLLLPLQAMGTFINIYSTFHDADVLLWLHKQPSGMRRFFAACAAFVALGCFQIITVKRAYSRQVQVAEVLHEVGVADDYDDRATTASTMPPLAGSERMLPAALLTGVPFLLVNWLWNEQCRFPPHWAVGVIWSANIVLITTVSLGLIEIDLAISSYIFKRYHYEPERHARMKKSLFPLVHIMFRAAEVFLRLVVITGYVVGFKRAFARELMVLPFLMDYAFGVGLLVAYSPTKENAMVHVIAGIGLTVADLGHFVDLPNFAAPARCITARLSIVRLVGFVLLVVVYLVMEHWEVEGLAKPQWLIDCNDNCDYITLFGSKYVLIAGAVYYTLRLLPQIRCLGDDLHTASRAGDAGRIRTLLRADQNGQVLDVNAEAKDRKGMTPLMLAAQNGHVEVIQELLHVGAQTSATDIDGNTCLHWAAMTRQIDCCRALIAAGADMQVRNSSGASPENVIPRRRSPGRQDTLYDELHELLHHLGAGHEEPLPDGASFLSARRSSRARSTTSTVRSNRRYTVNVAPTAGLQLRTLFPDVENDDTPSPRVLQSVSALVVSRAAGALSRRVLARQDERNTGVPLGALRRVRELGRGGFGRVIEVELPAAQRSSSLYLRASEPRRFALKLQLKQHQCQATSEVLALRRADHPFIVRLERAFSFSRFFALLLELCPTDLNRVLCEQDESGRSLGLRPSLAAKFMGQAALALAHLHRNEKIVFRDVKPENILISANNEAKLTDFGLAKVVTSAERMTMCGTMGFLPPELIGDLQGSSMGSALASGSQQSALSARSSMGGRNSAGGQPRFNPFKTDAFSFGVTLQVTLLGEDGARRRIVHRKGPMMLPLHLSEAENAELLGRLRETGRLSPEAHSLLVDKLLPHNPARRSCLTDSEVLNHPFFLKELGCNDLASLLLPSWHKESK
mmetsp:Transcript_57345/g.153607  ORF Transcript_57345/g.153607 Transcript_57345/m.153607 type:complete len:1184 (-) Transcript_57345:33-3584(-)